MVTSKKRWVETAMATKKSAINGKILTAKWLPAQCTKQQTNTTAKYYSGMAFCSIHKTRGFKIQTSDTHITPQTSQ